MTMNYDKLDLKEVINASGKMTILGVSKVSESVLAAQRFGGQHFFEMDELISHTGAKIAKWLQVEDAQIVSSASAGIVQTIAGIIGQGSFYHLYHPYSPKFTNREIILPKGHNVDYGTPVEVMVEQGGGELVEAGYANVCTPQHVEMMISEQTAAILYIKSHHTVQKSMLTVSEAAEIARKHNLPLIVDAAAEEDLFLYSQNGADLVIYSGAKAIEGPSAGLVIGKKKYIEWTRLQTKGLGRSMKIGKDNILGFTQAIEDYLHQEAESGEIMKKRLLPLIEELNEIPLIDASIVKDGAGRDIYRASVKVNGKKTASSVIEALKKENPAIYTREYLANKGIIEFDIRAVSDEEMAMISQRIKKIMNEAE
ncbi:DgaE family pyridoxal phosphate-dependent ammonia lyase [Enterococcus sp. LJL99]